MSPSRLELVSLASSLFPSSAISSSIIFLSARQLRRTVIVDNTMQLIERFWTTVTIVVHLFTLSPADIPASRQYPLTSQLEKLHQAPALDKPTTYTHTDYAYTVDPDDGGPTFKPPTGRSIDFPDGDFNCSYPTLGTDWVPCSTPSNRGCWLNNTISLEQYNITTPYETVTPPGIVRDYTVTVSNLSINADGIVFPYGKVFDGKFPGTWLQACWGDVRVFIGLLKLLRCLRMP